MSENQYAALPAAVRKQAEEADRLQAELSAATAQPTGNTENEPPAEPQKAPEGSTAPEPPEPGKESTSAEPGLPPAPPPASPREPASQGPSDTKPEGEDWRTKYLVLQGKYNAEVPRLAELVKTLQVEIEALKAGKPGEPKRDEPPKEPSAPEINPQDYEDYPDEIRALVARIDFLGKQNKDLVDRLAKAEGQTGIISQNQAKTQQQTFWKMVDERVPDWDAINKSPEFVQWLNEPDPFSGVTRLRLLEDATARMDVGRHVLFFEQYRREKDIAGQSPAKAGQPPAKPGIENQIAPGRGQAGAPPSGPAPTVTPQQLHQAAGDYAAGRIAKDQYDKIQAAFDHQMAASNQRK
ncbi:MAG TPA: hypothetical protein PK250_12780 [Syntrophobacter fumaroxidans]|nr:hypothetical protein [Syntrophobacter fumaroxidans]